MDEVFYIVFRIVEVLVLLSLSWNKIMNEHRLLPSRFKLRFSALGIWLLVIPIIIPALLYVRGSLLSPAVPLIWIVTGNPPITIHSVAFSDSGSVLASGGGHWGTNTGEVVLWNVQTQQLIKRLAAHDVYSVVFSPDEKTVAAGSVIWGLGMKEVSGEIRLWNVETGILLRKWTTHPIISLAFSSNGRTLMSAGTDGTVRFWDVKTGKLPKTLIHSRFPLSAAAFSPNGRKIGIAGNGEIMVCDAQTGKVLKHLFGQQSIIKSMKFSPDSTKLASGSFDNSLKLWDVESGVLIKTLSSTQISVTTSMAFSPDGKILASGHSRRAVALWNVQAGILGRVIEKNSLGSIEALSFSPNGKVLANSDGFEMELRSIRNQDVID